MASRLHLLLFSARRLAAYAVLALPLTLGTDLAATDKDPSSDKRATLKPADADGDGRVTRAEWGQLMQRFGKLDVNHDAAVSLAELQAAAESSDTPVVFSLADADGDGKLVRGEWKRMAQSFRRLDGDHNGTLELPELEAAAAQTAEVIRAVRAIPKLDGLWQGWIVDGRGEIPNAGIMQIELAISGSAIAGREIKPLRPGASPMAGAVPDLGVGTLVMTGNGRIGMLDAMYTSGPHSGQVCLGIFRREADVLYWCASNRSGYRPDVFATGSGCWLMILHRQPDAKTAMGEPAASAGPPKSSTK